MSVAIIAALPREVAGLVRGWKKQEPAKNITVYTNDVAVVACAGMGAGRAVLAVNAAIAIRAVTSLLSVGLAGACDPSLKVGKIIRAGVVIDSLTGERYENAQFKDVIVTGSGIASVVEKARLYSSYGASAIDMEAAAVARMARAKGLYFEAIKVISDEASFEIGELSRFATHEGQFREGAFAAYAAVRPRLWKKLIHLASNSKLAVSALTKELEAQLQWYRERG